MNKMPTAPLTGNYNPETSFDSIRIPDWQSLLQVSEYNPTALQQSGINNYQEDPALKAAQMQALQGLRETVDANGLDAQTKARLSQAQNASSEQERGNREAILANQRARGLGGSGAELAAQLANQQGSAQRLNQQGLDTAAIGEQRKSDALRDLANLGGNIRNQNFGQAESVARANDTVNQFNANNLNQAKQFNIGTRLQLPQQSLNNQIQLQQAKANELTGQAQMSQAQSNADRQFWAGLGGTAITAGAIASDKRVKEDVKPFDSNEFLDDLTGVKFRYTNPDKYGHGEKNGIMAQDLEKNNPEAVSPDEEGVKRIDYSKITPDMLAAMADMNRRLNEVEDKNG